MFGNRKVKELEREIENLKKTIIFQNKFEFNVAQRVIYKKEIVVITKREFNFYNPCGCTPMGNVYHVLFSDGCTKKIEERYIKNPTQREEDFLKPLSEIIKENHQ